MEWILRLTFAFDFREDVAKQMSVNLPPKGDAAVNLERDLRLYVFYECHRFSGIHFPLLHGGKNRKLGTNNLKHIH